MLTNLIERKNAFVDKARRFFTPNDMIKLTRAGMIASTAIIANPMFAMAGVDSMFNTLVSYVCKIFFYIGAILLVWSIGQLVLAFKNEDADSKSRAIMVLVCSLLLMSVRSIYNAVATQSGMNAPQASDIQIGN